MLSVGFKHGDSIALFMENRPEYVGLWLGCTKLQEDGELCEGSDIEQHQILEEGNHVCLRISAFSLELSESSCLENATHSFLFW